MMRLIGHAVYRLKVLNPDLGELGIYQLELVVVNNRFVCYARDGINRSGGSQQ